MNEKAQSSTHNNKLKNQRLLRNWTQEQVAEKIGTTRVNVNRWERGSIMPSLYFRQKLCDLFETDDGALGLPSLLEDTSQDRKSSQNFFPPIWIVPFRRNPFFTGREELLFQIHTLLQKKTSLTSSVAISGLGGIGKTQVALEYAYRYRDDYQVVLWARAESQDTLISDFVNFAHLLQLPEKDEQDQHKAVEAVKNWLNTHANWFLILDNLEDFVMVRDFLPLQSGGDILVTTRAQATGIITQSITLEQMDINEGALFLLRRAKLLKHTALLEEASETLYAKARNISYVLGNLPLALDQAGAYIDDSGCSLSDYLAHYQKQQARLLHR